MSLETFNRKASEKRKSARERHIEVMELVGMSESSQYFEDLDFYTTTTSSIEGDAESIQSNNSKFAIQSARTFLMEEDAGNLHLDPQKQPDVRLQEKTGTKKLKDRTTHLKTLVGRTLGVPEKKESSDSASINNQRSKSGKKAGIEIKESEKQTNLAPRRSLYSDRSTVRTQSMRDILSGGEDDVVKVICSSYRSFWILLATIVASLVITYAVIVNTHPKSESVHDDLTEKNEANDTDDASQTTSLRYKAILEAVSTSGFTDPSFIKVQGSSQNKALRWISDFDPFQMHEDSDAILQRYALATLFFATNEGIEPHDRDFRSEWIQDDNWLSGKGICLWYGVECPLRVHEGTMTSQYNENADVVKLFLPKNNIQGTIPLDLAALESLTSIDFSSNQIEEAFPPFLIGFEFLEQIALQNNSLKGTIPSSIHQCTNLISLDVSLNSLMGFIPSSISTLARLEELSVKGNVMVGNLPDMSDLTELRILDLSENQFRGTIPDSYGDLSNLSQLRFHQNKLEGTVPASLCRLATESSLDVLTADCNKGVECSCCHECFPRKD